MYLQGINAVTLRIFCEAFKFYFIKPLNLFNILYDEIGIMHKALPLYSRVIVEFFKKNPMYEYLN